MSTLARMEIDVDDTPAKQGVPAGNGEKSVSRFVLRILAYGDAVCITDPWRYHDAESECDGYSFGMSVVGHDKNKSSYLHSIADCSKVNSFSCCFSPGVSVKTMFSNCSGAC